MDRLGDMIEQHVDADALAQLIDKGTAEGLPVLESRLVNEGRRQLPAAEDADPSWDDLRAHGDRMVPRGTSTSRSTSSPKACVASLQPLDRVSSYPDESEAIRALAERHGRSSSEVLPTNGAFEAFWLVASALRARRAMVVHPSFTEPEVALRTLGRIVERAFRDPDDFSLDPAAVPEDADLVFVGNPDDPTGTLDRADALERLTRPDRDLVVAAVAV